MLGNKECALRVQINTTNASIEYAKKSIERNVPFKRFIQLMEDVVKDLEQDLRELKGEAINETK